MPFSPWERPVSNPLAQYHVIYFPQAQDVLGAQFPGARGSGTTSGTLEGQRNTNPCLFSRLPLSDLDFLGFISPSDGSGAKLSTPLQFHCPFPLEQEHGPRYPRQLRATGGISLTTVNLSGISFIVVRLQVTESKRTMGLSGPSFWGHSGTFSKAWTSWLLGCSSSPTPPHTPRSLALPQL